VARTMWRGAGTTVVAVILLAMAATSLRAFQQPPGQEAFQPFKPGDAAREVLPATPLVFFAYAFVWLVLLAYVFLLFSRLRRLEHELTNVSARLPGGGRR
jgi:CcmD family protein